MKKVGVILIVAIILAIGIWKINIPQRVIDIAIAKNDPSICAVVSKVRWLSPHWPEMPSPSNCYRAIALAHKNLLACEMDKVFDGDCYQAVAQKYNDISICKKVDQNTLSAGACYGYFLHTKTDISVCEALTNTNTRSSCFMYYVINVEPDVSVCDKKVENGFIRYKDFCYDAAARAQSH